MTASCTIDEALADSNLLGAALGDLESWKGWRTVLKAAFGEPLDDEESEFFAKVAGGRKPPSDRVSELWIVAGRRGGKSRMAAALAVYVAAFEDHKGKLVAGEQGHILALSPSRAQARTVKNYAEGFFGSSAILSQMVESTTSDEIRLKGNITISTHANSFRTIRGRSLLACIFDEQSFWRDENSANPDVETYTAVLPSLATTAGMLIGISTAYRRAGLLYSKYRDFYGNDDSAVLVIQAGTLALNPTVNPAVIERARKADPTAADAEWGAQFRSDLSALLDDAVIDQAIDPDRPAELPPRQHMTYRAFVDASAGRHDSFTICIGHREGERFIADVIRGRAAPCDPNEVASEFAALAKQYRCHRVVGDNFGGEWVAQSFKIHELGYERCQLPKSKLYLEMLPAFNRGTVSIPDQPILARELRLLERRTSRSGRDSVGHGQGGSDDFANALAGAMWSVLGEPIHTSKWRTFRL